MIRLNELLGPLGSIFPESCEAVSVSDFFQGQSQLVPYSKLRHLSPLCRYMIENRVDPGNPMHLIFFNNVNLQLYGEECEIYDLTGAFRASLLLKTEEAVKELVSGQYFCLNI